MANVTVDQVRAGMVLAAPVMDSRGRLLIPAGHELGERHVNALNLWGVTHVEIAGDEVVRDAATEINPEIIARAFADTENAFADNDPDHPFIVELRRYAVRVRATALAAAGGGS